jgi:dolichol-phosphate mannosyltransferase
MALSEAGKLARVESMSSPSEFEVDSRARGRAAGPLLSVIVPTFNELESITELVERLASCLGSLPWEVIVVDDDSPDGTAGLARQLARADARVRCVHRIGRRGLSSACIEGMLASSAPYLAVMDADLQHDEQLLPAMLDELRNRDLDIVVGSRYMRGGTVGNWAPSRQAISRFATTLSRMLVPAGLSDPMSGFFMLRRSTLEESLHNLSAIGFKILLDLFASAPRPLRFKELPYEFRTRHAGESKLDSVAAWDYGLLLLDKLIGRFIPVRFVAFSSVGGIGIVVHLLVVAAALQFLLWPFTWSQAAATLAAMTFNYAVNNALTYRDVRLRGWRWLRGWLFFSAACSVGGLANVGVAAYLFAQSTSWLWAAAAGIAVGAVWNYAMTNTYTWGRAKS